MLNYDIVGTAYTSKKFQQSFQVLGNDLAHIFGKDSDQIADWRSVLDYLRLDKQDPYKGTLEDFYNDIHMVADVLEELYEESPDDTFVFVEVNAKTVVDSYTGSTTARIVMKGMLNDEEVSLVFAAYPDVASLVKDDVIYINGDC